jgi:membrane protein DedA with SNARE-associated domain/membrane-associated phospholipid phosphatase
MFVKEIVDAIVPFFGHWGYLIVFIVAFLESIPLLGFLSPGGTTVIFSGFLARSHVLRLHYVIIFAVLGAFIGDTFSYFLGKSAGMPFVKKFGKYFFINEKHIEKGKTLIEKHPGKTIIFGRFNYITRSVGPFVIGASDLKPWVFIGYNIISAIIWGSFHSLAGFIFGEGVRQASHYISLISIGAIIFIVCMFYFYRFMNERHHVFKKYHLYTLLLNIFSVLVFTDVLSEVLYRGWMTRYSAKIDALLPAIRTPAVTKVMIQITNLADPIHLTVLCLLLFGFLLYKRRWYHALVAYFSLLFGLVGEYGIKALTDIARPRHPLIVTIESSFPSGHTTLITIFCLLVFYCFKDHFKSRAGKIGFLAANLLVIAAVGASRIYLDAHWVTDVVAGFALGLFSVTFFILIIRGVIFSEQHVRRFIMRHEPVV